MMDYFFNEFQTPIEDLHLERYDPEILEQFFDFLTTVPYIRDLVNIDRPRAKDLPRDSKGRIIVDVTKPHILEDMDYFREAAKNFEENGAYTNLRPNPNPNSAYGKWIREEVRRCFEGMVRPSDGEWITGDYYFFLNYCPMSLVVTDEEGLDNRILGFPRVWEGHYLLTHYLHLARINKKHAFQLASRARGKSFVGAALLAKRFILGESKAVHEKVISYITASDKKYLVGGDQTLDKFVFDIDHCTNNTEFPRGRIINAINDLQWVAGYKDTETGTNKGSLNSVIGVSSSKDEGKLRGTRGVLYILEEAGTFSRLLNTYGNLRHSVEQGKKVYGTIFGYGTAGDSESDFSAMQQIMYNPKGFNVNEIDNVYDKEGYGRNTFVYFFPAYMNYEGYYNKDGVSDVTGALLEILKDRYEVKYNSTDISAITKRIAEAPIVPQEAILRTRGNIFPTTQLTERVAQLDGDPKAFDDVYVGDLVLGSNGVVKFVSNNKTPIRDFPLKEDTPTEGAIEIFELPLEKEGRVMPNRYIIGFDPYDNDLAASKSLGSIFVLDLFTDRIVAEYTGRPMFADELYEKCRLLCMFYNAKCLYESNKKGTFAYFQKMNSTHLLADTPEYLRDKQLVKYSSFGSNVKGVNASAAINNYANGLLRDWLLKPVTTVTKDAEGKEVENTLANLYFVRNRALLRECIVYNPLINVDRIRSMGMVMLYREEKMILYNGEITENKVSGPKQTLALDPYFTRNYQNPITTSLFYLLF